ncbi:MAG: hypothetical protein ACR2QR_09175, partial [Woeseiaceae bacterium]
EAEKIGFLASKLAVMDRPADSYRELKNLGNHVVLQENIQQFLFSSVHVACQKHEKCSGDVSRFGEESSGIHDFVSS